PNNQEKTTNTSATGESSVQPNKGEISRRVCAVGFHATVGPMVKLFNGSPRVSFVVTFLYSISMPIFRRSLGKRIGIMAACEKPHSRPRSPVFSFSKNQFIAHSTRSKKSCASSNRTSYASGTLGGPPSSSSPPPEGGGTSSCRMVPTPNLYSANIVGLRGILFQSAKAHRASRLTVWAPPPPLKRSNCASAATLKR